MPAQSPPRASVSSLACDESCSMGTFIFTIAVIIATALPCLPSECESSSSSIKNNSLNKGYGDAFFKHQKQLLSHLCYSAGDSWFSVNDVSALVG